MASQAAPLHVVMNAGAGGAADEPRRAIEAVFREAGRRYEIHETTSPDELRRHATRAVADARSTGGVVVACGGDGTINTVAQAVLGSGLVFGVLPLGTFNYFARAHGIPQEPADAARVLVTGAPAPVQVGLVEDRVFLVNASIGLYPRLLEDREAYKAQFGRSRMVALGAALATFLREQRQLRLVIEAVGHAPRAVRTPLVFVGNNRLQLEQIGIGEAPEIDRGRLVAITLRPAGTLAMLALLVRGAFGRLGFADEVFSVATTALEVAPEARRPTMRAKSTRPIKVATDGEVGWMKPPLRFRISPEPLRLIVASRATAGEGE